MKVTIIPIVIGVLGSHKGIGTETERLGNKWRSGDHPYNSIIKIGQNIEKGPEDFRRLAVTKILWETIR